RLLAENITDVVMRSDVQGQYVYLSPSSLTMLGYEPDELMGQSSYNFIHPDDIAPATQAMMEAIEQNLSAVSILGRFRHKQGHYIWLESIGRIIRSEATG